MSTLPAHFRRDSFTWLAYAMLAFYAYLQSGLGPLMPFLAAEIGMSYTVRGLHLSAFALGMIIAGATGDRVARRFSRRRVWWASGAGMALGTALLLIGQDARITVLAAFIMGTLGSYLLVLIQATLADHHGQNRAIPLTESNVGAVAAAALAPFLVSQFEGAGTGWRLAMILGMAAWLIAIVAWRSTRVPEAAVSAPASHEQASSGRLPRIFWLYWCVIVLGVSVEWSTIFWGADFLERVVGFPRVAAVGAMTAFLLAMLVGRAAGSVLSRRYVTKRLLLIAALLVVAGFPVFWLARSPLPAYVGLALLGLGIANLYPLTLTQTTAVGASNANRASARSSLGSGVAILVMPQILGTVADDVGIQSAFLITGVLALGVLALVAWSYRLRHEAAVPRPA
jgi:predicted MFS family arabinose efflux permease